MWPPDFSTKGRWEVYPRSWKDHRDRNRVLEKTVLGENVNPHGHFSENGCFQKNLRKKLRCPLLLALSRFEIGFSEKSIFGAILDQTGRTKRAPMPNHP
jgi:hypothetical protein